MGRPPLKKRPTKKTARQKKVVAKVEPPPEVKPDSPSPEKVQTLRREFWFQTLTALKEELDDRVANADKYIGIGEDGTMLPSISEDFLKRAKITSDQSRIDFQIDKKKATKKSSVEPSEKAPVDPRGNPEEPSHAGPQNPFGSLRLVSDG